MKSSLLIVVALVGLGLAGVLVWSGAAGDLAAVEALAPHAVEAAQTCPAPDEERAERAPDVVPSERLVAVLPEVTDLTGGLLGARASAGVRALVGVRGRVRERGKARAVEATVRFTGAGPDVPAVQAYAGEYVVPALEPGAWRVSVTAPGYAAWSADVRIADSPALQTIDVELERTPHLKVRFETPQGIELGQALREEPELRRKLDVIAVATRAPPGDRLAATLEDTYTSYGKGTWKPTSRADHDRDDREPAYSGILELAQPLPGWVSACVASSVLRTRYVQRGTDAVTFVLSLDELRGSFGALRLRIVDAESGEPLTDGRVGLHANGQFGTGREIVDPGGWVAFDAEAPGPRHLSIVVRGHEWVVEQVWIEAGRVNDLGTYRLNKPVSIRGTLRDEQGAPVKAWVSVFPLDRYDATQRILEKFCWTSDGGGSFEVRPVGRRRYLLRVNDETWCAEPVLVDASAGAVRDVELVVVRGTPVTFHFGGSIPRGARLALFDRAGRPVAERAVDAALRARVRLAPGGYRLRLTFADELLAERSIDVGGGARDEFL